MNAALEIFLSLLFAVVVLTAGSVYDHVRTVEDAGPRTDIAGANAFIGVQPTQ